MAKTFEVAFNILGKVSSTFSSAFMTAAEKMSTLNTRVSGLKAELRGLDLQHKRGAISALEHAADYDKLVSQINKAEAAQKQYAKAQAWENRAKGMQGKAAAGLAGSAVAGAALAAPVVAFAKAEQSATALKASMMDAAGNVGPEFERINKLAVDLGNKLPGATSDFHDLFRVMLQNGIQAEQILGGVGKAAAYMAVQLKLPYEEAGKMAAQMQKSTGTADVDMMKLMDTIQKLVNLGTKTEDLNQALAKFGPTMAILKAQGAEGAKTYGVLLSMLTQTGMEGGSAGNALGKVFRAGFDLEKVEKANGLLQKFGVALKFTDAKGEFAGFDNFFQQIEKLKTLSATDRVSVIKELFGDDAEVLQTVNVLLEKGRSGYDALLSKTEKQASLEQRVAEQLKTMANTWESLLGTITNVMASIGGPIASKIQPLFESSNSFIGDKLMPWIEQHSSAIGTLGSVAAGATALSTAYWGLGLAASTALKPMIQFSKWLFVSRVTTDGAVLSSRAAAIATKAWAAAQWIWNAAMTANPIGLVIVGVAALIAAGYALYRNWDTVKQFMITLWDSPAGKLLAFIGGPIGILIMTAAGIIANWETLKQWFILLWNDPKAALAQFVDYVMQKFSALWDWLSAKWESFKALFSGGLGGAPGANVPGVPIAQNASGGIYGKGAFLTTFAERSAEAAIPLDGSNRAKSLWASAGEALGMGGGGGIGTVTFAPNITVNGGGADIKQQVMDAVISSEREFENMLERVLERRRRLAYD